MKSNYLLLAGIWMALITLFVCCTNPVEQSNVDLSIDSTNMLDTIADNMYTYFPPTPGNEWIFRRVFTENINDILQSGEGDTRKNHYGIYRFTIPNNGFMHCEAVDSIYIVDSKTETETLIDVKDTSYSMTMLVSAAKVAPNDLFSSLYEFSYKSMSTVTTTGNDSLQFLKYYHSGGSIGVWTYIFLRNVGPVYIEESSGSHSWMYGVSRNESFYLISFNGIPYNGEEITRQVLNNPDLP